MSGPDLRDPASVPVPLTFPDSGGPVRVAVVARTARLQRPRQLDLDAYVGTFVRRRQVARTWLEFFGRYPVVLTPIWSQPAFPHG